jgi:hypothetical protein
MVVLVAFYLTHEHFPILLDFPIDEKTTIISEGASLPLGLGFKSKLSFFSL